MSVVAFERKPCAGLWSETELNTMVAALNVAQVLGLVQLPPGETTVAIAPATEMCGSEARLCSASRDGPSASASSP